MCREKMAVTLFLLIILQIITGETKTVTKKKTSRKIYPLPKTSSKDIDLLKTYSFPQNDYPLLKTYSIYESASGKQEKYPSDLSKQSTYTQYTKKRRKSKNMKYQCNNVKKYSCDKETILQKDHFCDNINNSFPMVEYPLEASEIRKPTYWRTVSQDIPTIAVTATNQGQRRNRKRYNSAFKNIPKKEKSGKLTDKKKSTCHTPAIKYEILECENQNITNVSKSLNPCSKDSIINDSLIINLSEKPSFMNKCESEDVLADTKIFCVTEDMKKHNNESCLLDDSEFIFIPNDKNAALLFITTPPPFSTTESCDFNTDAVPLE